MGIVAQTIANEPYSYVLKMSLPGTNQTLGSKIINGHWIRNVEDLKFLPDDLRDKVLKKLYGDVFKVDSKSVFGDEVRFRKILKDEHNPDWDSRDFGKFTVASSLNTFGLDSGEYSIKKNLDRTFRIFVSTCEKFFEITKGKPDCILKIFLRGYSRGGVTASLLQNIFYKKYLSNLEESKRNRIQIYSTVIDPVPGPGKSKFYREVEINKSVVKKSVVMYSINSGLTNHALPEFFTPMKVNGADVVIITRRGHSCGQHEVSEGNGKIKFIYDGQEYSYSRLIELPDGLYYNRGDYYQTEELEKIEENSDLLKEIKKEIDSVNKSKTSGEPRRAKVLNCVIDNFFKNHSSSLPATNS